MHLKHAQLSVICFGLPDCLSCRESDMGAWGGYQLGIPEANCFGSVSLLGN